MLFLNSNIVCVSARMQIQTWKREGKGKEKGRVILEVFKREKFWVDKIKGESLAERKYASIKELIQKKKMRNFNFALVLGVSLFTSLEYCFGLVAGSLLATIMTFRSARVFFLKLRLDHISSLFKASFNGSQLFLK